MVDRKDRVSGEGRGLVKAGAIATTVEEMLAHEAGVIGRRASLVDLHEAEATGHRIAFLLYAVSDGVFGLDQVRFAVFVDGFARSSGYIS